ATTSTAWSPPSTSGSNREMWRRDRGPRDYRKPRSLSGQMRRNTRPTIDDSLIGPKNLESFDAGRLSPNTSTSLEGILVAGMSPQPLAPVFGAHVCTPFWRYGSLSGRPLM